MSPRRPDPASLPRAPDVAPALVGLVDGVVVAAVTVADCDRDGDKGEPEVADNGDGDVAAGVLVVEVEDEGALLVPCAVALKLRLTPTGLQICCAKASTSEKRKLS